MMEHVTLSLPPPPPPSVVCKLSATATSEEETLNSQQIEEAVRAEGLTAPALQNLFCLSHCLRYALQMCVWASVFVQQVGLLVFSHPRRINPAVTGMYLCSHIKLLVWKHRLNLIWKCHYYMEVYITIWHCTLL